MACRVSRLRVAHTRVKIRNEWSNNVGANRVRGADMRLLFRGLRWASVGLLSLGVLLFLVASGCGGKTSLPGTFSLMTAR